MSNVTVTISSTDVKEKSGTKNGKDWSIREQEAVIETPDRKQPVRLDLGKEDPYPVGRYALDFARKLSTSRSSVPSSSSAVSNSIASTSQSSLLPSNPAGRARRLRQARPNGIRRGRRNPPSRVLQSVGLRRHHARVCCSFLRPRTRHCCLQCLSPKLL